VGGCQRHRFQFKSGGVSQNASGKLFANKSQEQIPEDYRTSSREVAELTDAIAMKLS